MSVAEIFRHTARLLSSRHLHLTGQFAHFSWWILPCLVHETRQRDINDTYLWILVTAHEKIWQNVVYNETSNAWNFFIICSIDCTTEVMFRGRKYNLYIVHKKVTVMTMVVVNKQNSICFLTLLIFGWHIWTKNWNYMYFCNRFNSKFKVTRKRRIIHQFQVPLYIKKTLFI